MSLIRYNYYNKPIAVYLAGTAYNCYGSRLSHGTLLSALRIRLYP